METRELERIRFVTRHFNDLQGLRYEVPLGLIALGLGGATLLRAALFLGAFLLLLGARRHYRNSFGEVEEGPAGSAAELYPVSVFGPAGPIPRLEGFQQVTPFVRHFLTTLALAAVLFSYFQALTPNFVVLGDESAGQHPQIVTETSPLFRQTPVGPFFMGGAVRPPSMLRAVLAQSLYVLCGAFFLGLWLWRGRRGSQGHHLALSLLMFGLAAFGTSLGFLAWRDGEIPRALAPFLPALVYPGVALLLCGSSMMLAGLLDHWQIVRALGWSVAAEGEESR
ncbi:MAG TPA: hypothetical protein VKK31_15575 [Thermoanaerobaculia bacterium]|nr:hypothetical protein [Thermoanaerobaculia bacterium]